MKPSSLYTESQGNRGVPKASFVDELAVIMKKMPDSAFEKNPNDDIYSAIVGTLGPWRSTAHRKAAGFEAMVALAGRESSWNWKEGRDQSAGNTSPETEESGAWQTSFNGRVFHPEAMKLVQGMSGKEYISKAKTDHEFATLFSWYVLRGTRKHHGPVSRGEILPYLSKTRVEEIEKLLLGSETPVHTDDPQWVEWAKGELGIREGKDDKRIEWYHGHTSGGSASSSVAWCASFWCSALEEVGLKSTNSKWARDSLNWGQEIPAYKYGCTGVYERNAPGGDSHVGFVVGRDGDFDLVLAGNQGNAVSIEKVNRAKLLGYRWPA